MSSVCSFFWPTLYFCAMHAVYNIRVKIQAYYYCNDHRVAADHVVQCVQVN